MNEVDQHDIEDRVDRLLDQLEDPTITRDQIEKIEKKVRLLHSVKQ